MRLTLGALVVSIGLSGLTGCGDDAGSGGPVTLRLGHFPNITHATAIVGVEKGFFAQELGPNKLAVKTFNAGPSAVEALFSGAIDATYIGPNPAINAWKQSKGRAVKLVAGAASGGAFLVTKPEIVSVEGLRGKTIATPQLGNTQDVALRHWLKEKGFTTTKEGGGDVSVKPQDNAVTVDAFATGAIDGAWVPEPTASRLVAAGGRILVDERDLWPDGKFVVTHLLVSTTFLERHPDVVRQLIRGSVKANAYLNANPADGQQAVSAGIGKLTGKPMDLKLIAESWKSITFLDDPLAESLRAGARHAQDIGLLDPIDLNGIYDITLLNDVLRDQGATEVSA
jgi:NitT/TauT family transport system substrate-binding protein